MAFNFLARRRLLLGLVLAAASGCTGAGVEDAEEGPDFSNLVTVTGVITLNGEPLPDAVVTFLPPKWSPGVGETNAKGEYSLSSSGRPGLSPGDYKVAISLLVSDEGVPQGLGPRSSLAKPPGMLTAKEILPREYADLSVSKLVAQVEQSGGKFDFNVEAPGLVIPPRTAAGQGKDKGEVKDQDKDKADVKDQSKEKGAAAVDKPSEVPPSAPDAAKPGAKSASPP